MAWVEPVTGDPMDLRRAYGCFPSGVVAMCGVDGEEPVGIAASSFTSVSLDPALALVCVQNTSVTWPRLRAMRRIGVSMLGQEQQHLCRMLSRKIGDRFQGVQWISTPDGAVFIQHAVAWLECSVLREVPGGDHAIVLLAIHALRAEPDQGPLVFHGSRFHRLAS